MARYYLLAAEDLDPKRVAESLLKARLPAVGCAFDSLEAGLWDLFLAHAAEPGVDPRAVAARMAAAVGLSLMPAPAQPPG